jgi:hypothetical protein
LVQQAPGGYFVGVDCPSCGVVAGTHVVALVDKCKQCLQWEKEMLPTNVQLPGATVTTNNQFGMMPNNAQLPMAIAPLTNSQVPMMPAPQQVMATEVAAKADAIPNVVVVEEIPVSPELNMQTEFPVVQPQVTLPTLAQVVMPSQACISNPDLHGLQGEGVRQACISNGTIQGMSQACISPEQGSTQPVIGLPSLVGISLPFSGNSTPEPIIERATPMLVPTLQQVENGAVNVAGEATREFNGNPMPVQTSGIPLPPLPSMLSSVSVPSLPGAAAISVQPQVLQQQPVSLPSLSSVLSPSSLGNSIPLAELLNTGGEETVDIEQALANIPGIEGGPSSGGFSWHTMSTFMSCKRQAYYKFIMGLVPKVVPVALKFGTLYHACYEVWYRTGGQIHWSAPCEAVRQAGAPKLAGEVQKLVYHEMLKWGGEEAATWDVRAVEQNGVFYSEPVKINGKTVYVPFCCRHDLLFAKREPGGPCAPAGPVSHGVRILDHKTASMLSHSLTKGYSLDGQFMMNALVYTRSTEQMVFGPLAGMVFSVAVKHKNPTPESFHRVEVAVTPEELDEFYRYEMLPQGVEFYRMLTTPEIRENIKAWPKNRCSCSSKYMCPFFNLCDIGGSVILEESYRVDPRWILDVTKWGKPDKEAKSVVVPVNYEMLQKAREEQRKRKAERHAKYASDIQAAMLGSLQTLPQFDRTRYLVENHTRKTVFDQLMLMLRGLYNQGVQMPYGPTAGGNSYTLTVATAGFRWRLDKTSDEVEIGTHSNGKPRKANKSPGVIGTLSFKALAEAFCSIWWSLDNLQPQQ